MLWGLFAQISQYSLSILLMNACHVGGVFISLKGITWYSYKPNFILKTIFYSLFFIFYIFI
jgi:biotin transporter BioY